MTDEGWVTTIALDDLRPGRATHVVLDDVPVMLYRADDRIYALGNRCTHQGAPLDRGRVRADRSAPTVTCPAHGSMFRLEDGAVVRGPAHDPVPAYEARVTSGVIEVRPRAEGST